MTERQIFEDALEFSDAAPREVFLAQACAEDSSVRLRVDRLLASYFENSPFLQVPAVQQLQGPLEAGSTETPLKHPTHLAEEPLSPPDFSFLQASTKPGSLGSLGHYEILKILGQGALGVVFLAFDEKLHRHVAIKTMNVQMASNSPPRKRFLREARAAAAIRHPNVVQVHAVEEQPIPYLVMEYIEGQTLQQRQREQGPLDVLQVVIIGRQIASGLAAAHALSLVHRDVKPGNIMLEQRDPQKVKLTDFGLVRSVDETDMTQSGLILGTPLYMSPEQALGDTLDQRSDLFSLGSVMFDLATGHPPFRGPTTIAVLKRVVDDTPRPIQDLIPETPDWLVSIISKLMEKDRNQRFQSATEVAELLAQCQTEWQQTGQVTTFLRGTSGGRKPSGGSSRPALNTPGGSGPPLASSFAKGLTVGKMIASLLVILACLPMVWFILNRDPGTPVPVKPAASGTASAPPDSADPTHSEGSRPSLAQTGWHGWPDDAPPPAIAPFTAEKALEHQAAWAKYLNVKIEYTNSIGMKFCLIPPGEFLMGSPQEEIEEALKIAVDNPYWLENIQSAAPQHRVILTQPIYVAVNEVTQAEYEKVMGSNPSHFGPLGAGKDAVSGIETANHPVEMVSWNDAAEFLTKLSQHEKFKPFDFEASVTETSLDGTGYRLPTEAEWEFACRAGTTTRFWSGESEEDLKRICWYFENSGNRTHPVGELKANPWGLSETHGSVFEWVQDTWDRTYYSRFQGVDARNPCAVFAESSFRVVRGGSWSGYLTNCRASFRDVQEPTLRDWGVGFRAALPVEAVRSLTPRSE